MIIKIQRKTEDDLSKKEWTFYVDSSPSIKLSKYEESSRPTKRHRFSVVGKYEKSRWNDFGRGVIQAKDIVIPFQVLHELREEITNRVSKAVSDFWKGNEVEV